MPITAGSISVARRIKTGDYSHKEAKVELHFTAEGGEDYEAVAHEAETVAITRLASALATVVKLNGTPEIELGGAPPPVAGADLIEAMENAVAAEKKRHRRTKAEMEAARAAVPETAMPLTPLEQAVMQKAAEEIATFTPHYEITDKAVLDAPAEISDKHLDITCGEVMHRIKNKPAIQAVIRQYTDGKVSAIPQAQRAEFLEKVKAL